MAQVFNMLGGGGSSGGLTPMIRALSPKDSTVTCTDGSKSYTPKITPKRLLPEGYTALEYIESTGTQYIDTGINPLTSSKTVLNWSASNNSNGFVFGVENSWKSQSYEIYKTTGYKVWSVFANDSMSPYTEPTYALNTRYESKIINGEFFFNGSSIAKSSNSLSQSKNIFIFGNNRGGSVNECVSIRMYSFKFWQNGTNLSRDFIPCKNNTTNKYGMYDLVEGKFYGNANTSGNDFSAGAEVDQYPNSDYDFSVENNKTYTASNGTKSAQVTVDKVALFPVDLT